MRIQLLSIALLLAVSSLAAEEDEFDRKIKTINQLPPHVESKEGKLTLFADYDHPRKDGTIPVYVINLSDKNVILNAQDGDVYLKLEALSEDGSWVRAQPHAYSWCGNSYDETPELFPNHFRELTGYQPQAGDEKPIRFALYAQQVEVASNPGVGLVSKEDITAAANDAMSVKTGDFAFVSEVALGKTVLMNDQDHIKDLQRSAIYRLGSGAFDTTQSLEILRRVIKAFPEKKEDVLYSIKQLEKMGKKQ